MKPVAILLCAAVLSAADERIVRMLDPKLNVAQRNDACFALRGAQSDETIRALRDALSNELVQACAAARLREAGAAADLTDALTDPFPEVRAVAARELGIMAAPGAVPALAKAARDSNSLVSANAAYALTQYPGRSVLPQLLDLAKDGGMAGAMALTRAAELRDPGALAIARPLSLGPDPALRMYAINVIGDMGDASDLQQLRKIAESNERLSANSRGFGLLPGIDIARTAKTAIGKIEHRHR